MTRTSLKVVARASRRKTHPTSWDLITQRLRYVCFCNTSSPSFPSPHLYVCLLISHVQASVKLLKASWAAVHCATEAVSLIQAMVEDLLKEYPNCLILRVRMPIVADLTYPRNFITKIIKYDKVGYLLSAAVAALLLLCVCLSFHKLCQHLFQKMQAFITPNE